MMKLKNIVFVVLASVTALTGCDDKTSVEWYMAHHDDMLKKYEECLNTHTWEATDCMNANIAFKREREKPDVTAAYEKITHDFNEKHMK